MPLVNSWGYAGHEGVGCLRAMTVPGGYSHRRLRGPSARCSKSAARIGPSSVPPNVVNACNAAGGHVQDGQGVAIYCTNSSRSSRPHLREQLADEGQGRSEVAGLQLQRHQPRLDALAQEGALLRRRPLHLLPAHVQLQEQGIEDCCLADFCLILKELPEASHFGFRVEPLAFMLAHEHELQAAEHSCAGTAPAAGRQSATHAAHVTSHGYTSWDHGYVQPQLFSSGVDALGAATPAAAWSPAP